MHVRVGADEFGQAHPQFRQRRRERSYWLLFRAGLLALDEPVESVTALGDIGDPFLAPVTLVRLAQSLAQRGHVHAHTAFLDHQAGPHGGKKFVLAYEFACPFEQLKQQVEGAWPHAYRLSAPLDPAPHLVDDERPETPAHLAERRRWRVGRMLEVRGFHAPAAATFGNALPVRHRRIGPSMKWKQSAAIARENRTVTPTMDQKGRPLARMSAGKCHTKMP